MLPRLQDSMFIIHQYIMIAMQSSRHGTAGLLEFLNDARLFDTALTSLTQRERETDRQTDTQTGCQVRQDKFCVEINNNS